ncbi:hypothetical protein C8Q79DRAFT_1013478 [Trametes meyenii]|nr:hypothetical protein C8Q79DRAFT_1013478 [Trametes meyenii]
MLYKRSVSVTPETYSLDTASAEVAIADKSLLFLRRTASSPFDDPSTDTILRTADNVGFHVWRGILKEASSTFADMFSFPQSPSSESRPDGDALAIPVTEHSSALEPLLRLCYPVPDPTFSSFAELKPVLEVARKYQMDYPMQLLLRHLLVFAVDAPLQAYAVALQLGAADVARAAAKLYLRQEDSCAFTEELEYISAAAYYWLLEYRRKCVAAACDTAWNTSWVGDENFTFTWYRSAVGAATCRPSTTKDRQGRYTVPSTWFAQHLEDVVVALSVRLCRETVETPSMWDRLVEEGAACARFTIEPNSHRRCDCPDTYPSYADKYLEESLDKATAGTSVVL